MEKEQTTEQTINAEGQEAGKEGQTTAIISYLTLIGLIIALVMNSEKKSAFASFHISQMLGLCVCGLALGIIGMVPVLGWLISILGSVFLLILWILGIVNAATGKEKAVPVLGKKFNSYFKTLIKKQA